MKIKNILISCIGLLSITATLSTQSFLAPSISPEKTPNKTVDSSKTKKQKSKKKNVLFRTKAKSYSPSGLLPYRISENLPVSFEPNNFEWNPKNIENVFPTKHIRMQPKKAFFFDASIGVAFMRDAGLSGNLFPLNLTQNEQTFIANQYQIERGLSYNSVPLYEYAVGRRFTKWFRAGLSYQFQGGMTVSTQNLQQPFIFSQFTSNLSMNSFQIKTVYELPLAIPMGSFLAAPYLGISGGVVWQSWTDMRLNIRRSPNQLTNNYTYNLFFKPAYVASGAATADLGFRTQILSPYYPISFNVGCKFNYWGQVRNLASIENQGSEKIGMAQPLRIKALYQWTPYLSVEWNFTPVWKSQAPYKIGKHSVSQWAPFFAKNRLFSPAKNVWSQASVGLGSLECKKAQGVLSNINGNQDYPILNVKDPITTSKTPLFEFQIGYRFFTSLKASLSYQYQNALSVTTQFYKGIPPSQLTVQPASNYSTTSQFRLNLSLNALALKIYLESPWSLIWKNSAFYPYLGLGIGASWQTWYNVRTVRSLEPISPAGSTSPTSIYYSQQPKVIANAFPCADAGLLVQSAYPNSPYSLSFGIKFNYWGQARSLINFTQQCSYKLLQNSLKIKYLYQWAPYLGFQWNFQPAYFYQAPQKIRDKSIYRAFPFWVHLKDLDPRIGPWTGLNIGMSFLYFNQIKGNFNISNGSLLNQTQLRQVNAPFKGRLVYNSSPLYEYMMGYTLIPWLQTCLSFQHQGQIGVQTKLLNIWGPIIDNTPAGKDNRAVFSSNLTLDSLLLKAYLYTPYPLVMLGLSTNLYLAGGFGASMQTWNQTQMTYMLLDYSANPSPSWVNLNYLFKQTFCANMIAMADAGIVFQSATPLSRFSFRLGCKFNYWGQARNIGALKNQGTVKLGFQPTPFSIKGIYQVSPYAGVQWTF